ncbi:MAG TPA: hypothetical protein VF069_13565 [Streptosporangiaceae bacterium]
MTMTEVLAASKAPLRLLLVTPSPVNDPGRLHPEAELAAVNTALEQAGVPIDVVRLNPPTVSNLRRAIVTGKFDIVHIAAHCGDGIEFEDEEGMAITVSEDDFADLFVTDHGSLVVLNGCSTERLADRLAHAAPETTTLSLAGDIGRRDALRAVDEIYGLLFTPATAAHIAHVTSQAVLRHRMAAHTGPPIQARGPRANSSLFTVGLGTGRPTYYSCAPPANMPPQHRPMIDRAAELRELHRLLFDDVSSPYTGLVGIPGTGKTTLVRAGAMRYGWRFRDGIGYFSMRRGFAPSNLAEVFGWPRTDDPVTVQDAAGRLSRGTHLLILDDMDDAPESTIVEVTGLLNAWDTSLGGRAILVFYSHRPEFQSIIRANWMTVPKLPADASRELMVACLGGEDKARLAVGTEHQLSEASELCMGHPKTIEHAASLLQLGQRWPDMRRDFGRFGDEGPLAVNDEMLGRVIGLLERRAPAVRDLLTAWYVIEDSARESIWRTLAGATGDRERTMKNMLDAALRELDGAALIDRYPDGGDVRCVMHSLLVDHLRRRHAAELSEEKMRELVRAQLAEQTRLAAEQYPTEESGNVRRALQVAENLGLWQDILSYCDAVVGHQSLPIVRRGPWPMARDLLETAVHAAAQCADQEQEARFLVIRGMVEYRLAAFDVAAAAYRQAAGLATAAQAAELRMQALRGIGQVRYRIGDIDGAQQVYEDARRLAADEEAAADIDHQLAKILYRKNRLEMARKTLLKVRAARTRPGRERDLAKTIHEQARVEHAAGRVEEAQRLYEEALHLERQVNDPVMEQATLFQLAKLALGRGRKTEAERLFAASRRISEELEDQVWIVHARFGRALLDWDSGHHDRALATARTALEESRELHIGLTAEIQEWLDSHTQSSSSDEGS